jgi:hypothetical protein
VSLTVQSSPGDGRSAVTRCGGDLANPGARLDRSISVCGSDV